MDFDVRRSVIQVLDNVFFTSSNQASKQTNKRILFRMTLPSVDENNTNNTSTMPKDKKMLRSLIQKKNIFFNLLT